MRSNYNINQLSLYMATFYEPEKIVKHTTVHHLVESIDFDDSYTLWASLSNKYEPQVLLKLVLFGI